MTTLKQMTTAACIALATGAAQPASAQSTGWSYEGTLYLFMPRTDTTIGTAAGPIESSLSFSDALDNLDMAFMGGFAATNGKWSFLLDYMYYDLGFNSAVADPAYSGLDTSVKTQIMNGYVAYRVYEDPSAAIDLAGGFRWFDTDTTLRLQPGTSPGRSASSDDSWVDPVIGLRARVRLADRWTGTGFFDYGGFSDDSETWQALVTVDDALTDNWLLRGGYRYISVDHTTDGSRFQFSQSGPILGAAYRF